MFLMPTVQHFSLHFLRLLFFSVLHLSYSVSVHAQETLTFSALENNVKGKTLALEIQSVIKHAYEKLGIQVEFSYLPTSRGIIYSNSGQTDGQTFSTKEVEDTYKNLIRVNVPMTSRNMYLFTKQGNEFNVMDWGSIPKDYVLGYKRGVYFVEQAIEKYGINSQASKDSKNSFLQLHNNRVKVVLSSIKGFQSVDNTFHLDDIVRLEPPVYTAHLYHYLHSKHAELVPEITRVLREMKTSGEIDDIRKLAVERAK